jgi:hypothetical protein
MQKYGTMQGLSSRVTMVCVPPTLRMATLLTVFAGLFSLASLERVGAAGLGQAAVGAAQTPASAGSTVTAPQKKTVHPHKRSAVKPSATQAAAQAPVVPAAPPAPYWPANDHPHAATVVWDSHGLHVEASNSSLEQILKDVSTATGAKLEGFSADQRVFGSYGPGTAREVLSQLLDGSGYNVVLIGDQGEGTPREIVLSSKPTGPAPIAGPPQPANAVAEEEPETPPEPPSQPYRNGMVPFGAQPEMRNERQGMPQLPPQPPQTNPPYATPNNPQN